LFLIVLIPLLILIIFVIGTILLLTYHPIKVNQNNALRTEAVYSSFGYPGYVTDVIELAEMDEHGRILYRFWGHGFANYQNITHILVCQYIDYDKGLVYYYPETNFIIHLINEEVSYEQLEQLKLLNDWNKEIDLSKCISKKIGTYKEINDELEIGNIFDDLNIDIDTQYNNINELNVYSKKN
jgi:hypothetical protein